MELYNRYRAKHEEEKKKGECYKNDKNTIMTNFIKEQGI